MKPTLQNKISGKQDKLNATSSAHYFLDVGERTSIAGLTIFKQLQKAITQDSGIAFVLVHHHTEFSYQS